MSEPLRRYTNVLSLLHILRNQRLSLRSPDAWYDQNDALGLRQYAKRLGEGSVYALCFATGYEQAHHWQIFSGDAYGVCIQFDKSEFIEYLNGVGHGICHGPVLYCNLTQIRAMKPISLDVLPFLKRDTFKAEAEYRIVGWIEKLFAGDSLEIPLPLNLIKRVILGPAMPQSFALTLKELAGEIEGCSEIQFTKSKLSNNESWADAIAAGLGY